MKKQSPILVLAIVLIIKAHADPVRERAHKVQQFYQQAVTEMQAGKIEEARTSFQNVLKLQPGHGHARYHLSRLDTVGKQFALKKRKEQFEGTKIAQVDFHDATLSEVMDSLNLESQKITKETFHPNFMIQDPSGKLKNKRITLTMKNVPLSAVLTYVLDMVGASARFDQHATIIRPR